MSGWAAFLLVLQLLNLQLFTQANIVMLQRIWPFIPMVLLADWWLGRKSVVWGSAAGALGWLIVLGVMLAVTLVASVVQAVTDIPQILDGKVWVAYTTPGQPVYDPGWAALLALDWGSNLFVLVFFPVLLSLFLQKKKTFRSLTTGTLLLFVVLSMFRLWLVNQVPHFSAAEQAAQFWSVVFAFGKAVLWIPYLLLSRRSKATFEF